MLKIADEPVRIIRTIDALECCDSINGIERTASPRRIAFQDYRVAELVTAFARLKLFEMKAYHMVIEHTLFFFLEYLSVQVSEIILRLLVSSNTNRKSDLKGIIILFWTS